MDLAELMTYGGKQFRSPTEDISDCNLLLFTLATLLKNNYYTILMHAATWWVGFLCIIKKNRVLAYVAEYMMVLIMDKWKWRDALTGRSKGLEKLLN